MRPKTLGIAALVVLLAAVGPAPVAFANGGDEEFQGVVESLPATPGFIGDWVVSGKVVHVTASTEVDQEEAVVAVGASVEVQGTLGADGSITADEIDVQEGAEEEDFGVVEFFGTVQSLPPTPGFIGDWVVSGRVVHVTTSTEIEQEDGTVAVGAFVEVQGLAEADGSITARQVEVKDGTEDIEDGSLVLSGVVQRLPQTGSLTGDWRVSRHLVHVRQSTVIVRNGNRLARGADVRVRGMWRADGSIRATKVVVRG